MHRIHVQNVRFFITLVCLLSLFSGCNLKDPLPIPIEDISCHKIKVAPGPEDFVLDIWHGDPRLLLSSHDRRNPEISGGIYYFDIHGSLDMYTRSKSSEIAYFDHVTETWKKVADDIAFANGILAEENRVYVTATFDDQVMAFPRTDDGSLGTPEKIVRVKGPDNIMRYKNSFLITAHYDDLAAYYNPKNEDLRIHFIGVF